MNNTERAIQDITESAAQRGLSHFQLGLIDSVGRIVGKRYHVDNLRKAMTEGVAIVSAIASGMDTRGAPIGTSPYFDPSNGFADGLAVVDADSLRDSPLCVRPKRSTQSDRMLDFSRAPTAICCTPRTLKAQAR